MKCRTIATVLILTTPISAFSYWDEAHKSFASITTEVTQVNTSPLTNYYEQLGFDMDSEYPFDNSEEFGPGDLFIGTTPYDKKPWTEIILEGSKDEDYPLSRPLNHFFDPVNNHSLYQTMIERGWGVSVYTAELFSTSTTNPNWALEDNNSILQQNYSLKDSQDLLYKALTEKDQSIRDKALGEHFYALAHVLHLLADMGQPEHGKR